MEEEMIAAYSDDSDEENIFHLDNLKPVMFYFTSDLYRVTVFQLYSLKNKTNQWHHHFLNGGLKMDTLYYCHF